MASRCGWPTWISAAPQRAGRAGEDARHGIYGYFGDDRAYLDAIRWWMANRHGWEVAPDWIFTTHGLVNGTALCVDSLHPTGRRGGPDDPGLSRLRPRHPRRRARGGGMPAGLEDGTARMDFAAWEKLLTGREKMLILCSPHNPGGRVWTRTNCARCRFLRRHDLILVSDEIHHDLVYPGQPHTGHGQGRAQIADRLVMMTATTKTFNIAGAHIGNVIIADPALRKALCQGRMNAMGISPNSFGMHMATAAYSPEGAAWVDALMRYLDGNRKLFDEGVERDPGPALHAAGGDLSGLGRFLRHRHGPGGVHRPGREGPRSPPTTAPASAWAGKASCASTSPARAPRWPRRWPGCKGPSPTCNDPAPAAFCSISACWWPGLHRRFALQPAGDGSRAATAAAGGRSRPDRDRERPRGGCS
jgi:bifunctional pyridoxal-dependent enzyme with beta-cystathionase and maltose regulon repressor activities